MGKKHESSSSASATQSTGSPSRWSLRAASRAGRKLRAEDVTKVWSGTPGSPRPLQGVHKVRRVFITTPRHYLSFIFSMGFSKFDAVVAQLLG